MRISLAVICFVVGAAALPAADDTLQFQNFVRGYAAKMRANDRTPTSADEWLQRKAEIRRGLEEAWDFPNEKCPLEPKQLGEEQRDGYRFEKLIFQTMPGVWMTAHAYIPDGKGPFPAILQVHGHWKGAKQDPVPQARCIGAAKQGFFVLAVDAFGAGERGLGKNLGEYHGEMVGATLFPVGKPLSGIQVYENMRAVDYLQSRPEVIPAKIGITGASGGGNQSMYAGAYDERFSAVVPVCSVGTYQAYLGAACCMCEVVPGAMTFTEEAGILSLVAPRALMVINASKDAFQFSVGETTNARTALLTIDYGGVRPLERYRVATNVERTSTGKAAGVRLGDALQRILGLAPGVGYDRLVVTGPVALGSARLQLLAGFVPPVGTTFVIIDNDGADPRCGLRAFVVVAHQQGALAAFFGDQTHALHTLRVQGAKQADHFVVLDVAVGSDEPG